jgi:hypothetical protein
MTYDSTYLGQNKKSTKKDTNGIPSFASQVKQLVQEHRVAIETLAGNTDLLNSYRIKISALGALEDEANSNVHVRASSI